jgi:hypothetical protein
MTDAGNSKNAIRTLFERAVDRDIPPVVYFHQDSPAKLADEVREYIITGGWEPDHPNHKSESDGIHEQFVKLLTAIADQVDPKGIGLRLPPAVWISGFYGSGKSSFAKLLGMALDGRTLPDGQPLAAALLARDRSQNAKDLRDAWERLVSIVDPIAVVFDIGGKARGAEQVHRAILRHIQARLGYCPTPSVAAYELKLQRAGEFEHFKALCQQEIGRPWAQVSVGVLPEHAFSRVMARQFPETFKAPIDWFVAFEQMEADPSAADAVEAIADMLRFTGHAERTLFIVVDEVSQYLHQDTGRMLALQSFVSELQQRMQGRVWLMVTGQEKLDDAVAQKLDFGKMQDRFPPRFRVHLGRTNVRTVVHRRLLEKKKSQRQRLKDAFAIHRPKLSLYALDCATIAEQDFIDLYPLLPGHIDLILKLTSALRRSSRSQGDDQTIRGLLQLLGEVFRSGLADKEFGHLVTLEDVYEVQHTSLAGEVQDSIARSLNTLRADEELSFRIIKVVALLELLADEEKVSAKRVAQALYQRLGDEGLLEPVTAALEDLQRRGVLGYTERRGFKLQSSIAEEWASERDLHVIGGEARSALVKDALEHHMERPDRPRLKGTQFSWSAVFTDDRGTRDAGVKTVANPNALVVDFRYLPNPQTKDADWRRKSDEEGLRNRLVWVCGDRSGIEMLAEEYGKSDGMLRMYRSQKSTLGQSHKELLLQEEGRLDDLSVRLRKAVAQGFMAGILYFRGRPLDLTELGEALATALEAAGERVLPELFQHFNSTRILPRELEGLITKDLVGVSAKFLDLGLLSNEDSGYEATCHGHVPLQILSFVKDAGGTKGTTLLNRFGGPPYGYDPSLIRAAVAALLHGSKLQALPDGKQLITAMRDAGARDLFTRDRDFKSTTWTSAAATEITASDRARIVGFFKKPLKQKVPRDDGKIADSVDRLFPELERKLRRLQVRFKDLPKPAPELPAELTALDEALTDCLSAVRQTLKTVITVKRHLPVLKTGVPILLALTSELDDETIERLSEAAEVRDTQAAQLIQLGSVPPDAAAAIDRLLAHFKLDSPWIDVARLATDLKTIRTAYRTARAALLSKQLPAIEEARKRVKARKGYESLSNEESNGVLLGLRKAADRGGDAATEPALVDLTPGFDARLKAAEDQAMQAYDALIERKALVARKAKEAEALLQAIKAKKAGVEPPPPPKPTPPPLRIVTVYAQLGNREIDSIAELDTALADLRARVEAKLAPGVRVRLK